jgi:bifunctional isochorismate lyase/aryl carrier protein
MSLPKISAYPMPVPSELPDNRVAWPIDARRVALLVHDMQGYFVDAFPRDASPARELVGNVRRLIEAARACQAPIFYSAQPGGQSPESRGLLADFWGPGLSRAEHDEAILPELGARESALEVRLTKHRYSAFQRTPLLQELRTRGCNQLIVCGVYAHLGCLLTANEAFMNDIRPFFVADAVADFTPELHAQALRYAASRCARTLGTDALLTELALSRSQSEGSTLERLRSEVCELLDEPGAGLEPDESLLERGLDSMRLMILVERFQQRGASVTFGDLAEEPTLRAWCELLERSGNDSAKETRKRAADSKSRPLAR